MTMPANMVLPDSGGSCIILNPQGTTRGLIFEVSDEGKEITGWDLAWHFVVASPMLLEVNYDLPRKQERAQASS